MSRKRMLEEEHERALLIMHSPEYKKLEQERDRLREALVEIANYPYRNIHRNRIAWVHSMLDIAIRALNFKTDGGEG